MVIGDSFVWGSSCLNRNEFFWHLVETDLRKKGYDCRIFAVGIAGASAYDELDWLTKSSLVKDLDPDLVLFGYVYNDTDPDYNMKTSPVLSAGTDSRIPFSSFLQSVFPNLYVRLNNNIVAKTMYDDTLFDKEAYFLPSGSNLPIFITKGELFEKYKNEFVIPLDNYAKQADFPIVYMTLPPSPSHSLLKALFEPICQLYSQYTNVDFYDSLDEFCYGFASRKHAANYALNPADYHPGSATNRFYADYIVEFLERDYPDVIGESCGKDLNNYDILINDCMPGKIGLNEESRNGSSVTYSLEYPSEIRKYVLKDYDYTFSSYLLSYPLGEDYIKLSFAQPIDIESVQITGDKVQNIDLYYTKINEKLNYDDHSIIPFGTKSADGTTWNDTTDDKVTSLCIHADCINKDGSNLKLVINKQES